MRTTAMVGVYLENKIKNTGIVLWCIAIFTLFWPAYVVQASAVDAGAQSQQSSYVPGNPAIKTAQATSGAAVCLTWDKVKRAGRYTVYRASEKNGTYKKLKVTSKCTFTDKTGKQLHTYYYKVSASCKNSLGKWIEGKCSKAVAVKVRRVARKTAYVGDSIMSGFSSYGVIKNTKKHRVISKIGISTTNFYNGKWMDKLLNYKPDRMFIMLGVNALPGKTNPTYINHIIKYYGYILKECLKENPNMEIIVMSVSPVKRGGVVRLKSVKLFNQKLEELLKDKKFKDVHYLDLFPVLADSSGYLKKEYSAGDSVHWKKNTYKLVLKEMKEFIKKF